MSSLPETHKRTFSDIEQTRTQLCEEFASVTGSDSAVAQCYLTENEWEMERALNSFYEADLETVFAIAESPGRRDPSHQNKRRKTDISAKANCADLTEDPACSSKTDSNQQSPENDDKLSIISWNVDGLDTDLQDRARGLCSYLALYTPDVVFLQELVPPYVQYLKKRAVSYLLIESGEEGYFTGMMLKKSRVKLLQSNVVPYPTTQMARNLLVARVTFRGLDLCLMTSHFESCKAHAEERMKQLRLVLRRIAEVPDNITVLFGGDTNLRDAEVAKVGLPRGVCDIWEQLGRQEHCRYTWDTKANSNLAAPYSCRCRFDRVYLRPATGGDVVPHPAPFSMALIGLEKLDCGRYTSDHWGIYAQFTTSSGEQ